MSSLIIRLVSALLFAAIVLGAIVHPPENLTQGLGMLMPAAMLLGTALRGTGRSRIPRKRVPPATPAVPDSQRP
ncbi:hypothetical protein P2318_21645 [Myxococcaceae bacterium GXIMD 01537]